MRKLKDGLADFILQRLFFTVWNLTRSKNVSQTATGKSGDILGKAAKSIEAAGADFILICTNTMHKVVPQIESMIQIPIIHIADATAQELLACQIRKSGLVGHKIYDDTRFFISRG